MGVWGWGGWEAEEEKAEHGLGGVQGDRGMEGWGGWEAEEEKAEHESEGRVQGERAVEAKGGSQVGWPGVYPAAACLSVPIVKPPLSLSNPTCNMRTPTVSPRGADPQKEDGAAWDAVTVPAWPHRGWRGEGRGLP